MLAIINSNQKGSLAATQRYTTGIYRTTSKSPAGSHLSASFIGSVRIVFFYFFSCIHLSKSSGARSRAIGALSPWIPARYASDLFFDIASDFMGSEIRNKSGGTGADPQTD